MRVYGFQLNSPVMVIGKKKLNIEAPGKLQFCKSNHLHTVRDSITAYKGIKQGHVRKNNDMCKICAESDAKN